MNGIWGYLRLNGAPVDPEKLEAMQKAMAYWGTDGSSRWQGGPIGLGCHLCVCTPETTVESLPYHDRDRNWIFAAGAFLDNREDLVAELGLSAQESPTTPDSHLILSAYRKWGEGCVHHLSGDWHFALWDIKARRLFVARDQAGNTGLCYTMGRDFFAFSSGRKALLALPEVPRKPDMLRLAQILTSWPGDGVHTSYEGIHRLPPAHYLTVSDGKARITRYWYAENAPEVHFPREEDYLEAFLAEYDRAVRSRLRSNSPVGTTLSGGLDSGSVSVLAARALGEKQERLRAFTSIPVVDTRSYTSASRFGDESDLARATAEHAGNIDITWIRGEDVSPVAGVNKMLEVHDEPGHAAANQFWIADLLEHVRTRSLRVLLTGQRGNATVSWTGGPANLLPLLRPWTSSEFIRRFHELRNRYSLSTIGGIKRFLLGPILSPLLTRWKYGIVPIRPVYLAYSAINPSFAASLDLTRFMKKEGHDALFRDNQPSRVLRQRIFGPGRTITGALWGESGGAYGLEIRDPTQDKRLMELCLGIPDEYYHTEGMDKAILRRAFQGQLPDKVRLNPRKGLQAADLVYRLQLHLQETEEAFQRVEKHPLAKVVLDIPRMRGMLESVRRGPTLKNTSDITTILLRGMGAGVFLLRF